MFDRRVLTVIACAVGFGLVAALLVSRYLSNVRAQHKSVVAASVGIPTSTQITADQLTYVYLPADATPEGTFTSMDKLVGRVTVTGIGIREPLTELKLAPEGSAAGLAAMITEGARAMTVKVDDVVGVAGFVLPGAWVDVVCVIDPSEQGGTEQGPTSKIVLQHMKVLASDRNIEKQDSGEITMTVKAVTLQVSPEEAEKLALAATEGKLQLVLRNSIDDESVTTRGIDKKALLGLMASNQAPPAPVAAAAASRAPARPRPISIPVTAIPPPPKPTVRTVEMIEAGKRRLLEFPQ